MTEAQLEHGPQWDWVSDGLLPAHTLEVGNVDGISNPGSFSVAYASPDDGGRSVGSSSTTVTT